MAAMIYPNLLDDVALKFNWIKRSQVTYVRNLDNSSGTIRQHYIGTDFTFTVQALDPVKHQQLPQVEYSTL
jgi:hypothetical protein